MKRLKLNFWDFVVASVLVGIAWSRDSVQVILLVVIAFLLYLLVRLQFSSVRTNTPPVDAPIDDDEAVFQVDSEEPADVAVYLNADINYRTCVGHFKVYSRYDTCVSQSEYEYRIEGTEVLVRVLQNCFEDIGVDKTWDVRDGVVQESDIRAREAVKTFQIRDVEEDVADWKKRAEWNNLRATDWNGLKYFILSKNMEKLNARRYFRQEIERLRMGADSFIGEATKLGLESDDKSLDGLRLSDGRQQPPNDDLKKLWESATSFGITHLEFCSRQKLIIQLQKFLE